MAGNATHRARSVSKAAQLPALRDQGSFEIVLDQPPPRQLQRRKGWIMIATCFGAGALIVALF